MLARLDQVRDQLGVAGVEADAHAREVRPLRQAVHRECALDAAPEEVLIGERPAEHRTAPLEHAQPSLRPVHELGWEADGLHLRLTGQGPWTVEELVRIAASVG